MQSKTIKDGKCDSLKVLWKGIAIQRIVFDLPSLDWFEYEDFPDQWTGHACDTHYKTCFFVTSMPKFTQTLAYFGCPFIWTGAGVGE